VPPPGSIGKKLRDDNSMCVHMVRSKENPLYLYRFYTLHYVQVRTQLSHLSNLYENYLQYKFRRCQISNPVGVVFNSYIAKLFPYNEKTPSVSNTAAIMNSLSVLIKVLKLKS